MLSVIKFNLSLLTVRMPPKKRPARGANKQDTPLVGNKSAVRQVKLKLPVAMRAGVTAPTTSPHDLSNSSEEPGGRSASQERPPSRAETVVAPILRASSRSPTR